MTRKNPGLWLVGLALLPGLPALRAQDGASSPAPRVIQVQYQGRPVNVYVQPIPPARTSQEMYGAYLDPIRYRPTETRPPEKTGPVLVPASYVSSQEPPAAEAVPAAPGVAKDGPTGPATLPPAAEAAPMVEPPGPAAATPVPAGPSTAVVTMTLPGSEACGGTCDTCKPGARVLHLRHSPAPVACGRCVKPVVSHDHSHLAHLWDWLCYRPNGACGACCMPHCQPPAYAYFLDMCAASQGCTPPPVVGCATGGCGANGTPGCGRLLPRRCNGQGCGSQGCATCASAGLVVATAAVPPLPQPVLPQTPAVTAPAVMPAPAAMAAPAVMPAPAVSPAPATAPAAPRITRVNYVLTESNTGRPARPVQVAPAAALSPVTVTTIEPAVPAAAALAVQDAQRTTTPVAPGSGISAWSGGCRGLR